MCELFICIVDKDYDISNDVFFFMGCVEIIVCGGFKVCFFCIFFFGELVYEIVVFICYGDVFVCCMMEVGVDLGVMFYGFEVFNVMWIEKGYVIGVEIDGCMIVFNMGLDWMVLCKKDCIGFYNS